MKLHFGYLLALSTLMVAGCAAFFSVYGLSQLFAGASTAVIVMASALEFSKIISASFLHKFWGDISKTLRIYLTIGVIVLVTITSAGIYGFLSNAYQKTANNLELHDGEVGIVDVKIKQYQDKIDANNRLIDLKTKRVSQLNDLRVGQESRLDGGNKKNARLDISNATNEIKSLNAEIDDSNKNNSIYMDSISKYNLNKLNLKNTSKVAGEVGPLKYIAQLTGYPMDKVVNIFILLLIFVFDPLAIALVIATNWYFERRKKGLIVVTTEPEIVEDVIDEIEEVEIVEEIIPEVEIIEEIIPEVEVVEKIIPEPEIIEEIVPEVEVVEEILPVVEERRITRDDIKEIKERERGFSVNIPKPKNTIERIGNNKIIKNGDSNNLIFKRDN